MPYAAVPAGLSSDGSERTDALADEHHIVPYPTVVEEGQMLGDGDVPVSWQRGLEA